MSGAGSTITGAILAGGRGLRMGGLDKGLLEHRGRPLVEHVLEALRPQVGPLLIVANRNGASYQRYGLPVHPDLIDGFQGPLAGLHTALSHADTELVLCVPCDVPALPADLARRMHSALEAAGADACAVHDGRRLHPVICLLRRSLAESLEQSLAADLRQVKAWLARQRFTVVDYADAAGCFENFNCPEQLGDRISR